MKKIVIIFSTSLFLASTGFAGNNNTNKKPKDNSSQYYGPYHITVKVKGLKDTICWLGNYFGKQTYFADTSHFDDNGVAVFNATHKPHGVYLFVMPGYKTFEFIFNEPNITLSTDTSDYVGDMQVTDSKENQLFYQYMQFVNKKGKESKPLKDELKKLKADSTNDKKNKKQIDEIDKKLTKIDDDVNDYRLNVIKNNPNSFVAKMFTAMKEPVVPKKVPKLKDGKTDSTFKYRYFKTHYWDGFDFSDQRMVYSPVYANKLKKYFSKVLLQDPDTLIRYADSIINLTRPNHDMFKYTVQSLTNEFEQSHVMGMDKAFVHMGEKYYLTGQADWIDSTTMAKFKKRMKIMAPLLLGKQIHNLTLMDTSGKWIPIYSLQAKYTILIFWDPDCGHCQKELPVFSNYMHSLKSDERKQIKVYTVSSQDGKKWKDFINKNKMNFVNTAVPHKIYKDQTLTNELVLTGKTDLKSLNYHDTFDVYSTPTIYLLDKDKKIIIKRVDVDTLDKIMTEKLEPKKDKKK